MPPDSKLRAPLRLPANPLDNSSPALSALLEHAARLRRLDHQLRLQLAWAESATFEVANVRTGTLVLTTPLATVASRIRLEQTRILESASRSWGAPLNKLMVRTIPAQARQSSPPVPKSLSTTAAQQLRAAASVTNDPELSDLLKRMASLAE